MSDTDASSIGANGEIAEDCGQYFTRSALVEAFVAAMTLTVAAGLEHPPMLGICTTPSTMAPRLVLPSWPLGQRSGEMV